MSQPIAFADVLDAAEQLDADSQAELVAILTRRLAERGRERVIATVEQARRVRHGPVSSDGCGGVNPGGVVVRQELLHSSAIARITIDPAICHGKP